MQILIKKIPGVSTFFSQAADQSKRYDGLVGQCKNINGFQDLTSFARSIQLPPNAQRVPKKAFAPPQPIAGEADESNEYGVSLVFFLLVISVIDINIR